ncbi:neprilysin-3-like [Amblyomma americanum]
MSPKAGARSPMSGTAGTKSPDRGAASPIKASPTGSVSPKIKKVASKVKIGSPSRSPAAAGAKAKDGKNGEEPPKVAKSRPLDAVGRRKSSTAAAMFKMVRKSLRPQSAAEGNTGESSLSSKDQMSLVMVVTMAGFLFVFVITVTFFYLISGESIPEGVACITEECLKARKYLDGLLNETKDPCVDFYGYVCDSWHQTGISFHTASVLSQLFRLNLTLFHKREEFRKDEQRQGMHILGPVYRSCYRYMSTPVALKDALLEAQTVLLIQQLMHAATFFDVVRYLVRQSLQLGVYTLFHLRFIYEAGRPMLYMHEGYTLEGKLGQSFDTADALNNFENVLQLWLERDNVSDALQLLVDIDAAVKKFFAGKEPIEKQQTLLATVNDMVVNVTANDWVAAVSDSHRHTLVLVPTDEIVVKGAEIFRPAMQLVVKHGLDVATFYLATVFEADVVYILSSRERIAQSEVYKGMYCLSFAHKTLALTWAYLAARHLSPAGSTGVIYNMLSFMKKMAAKEGSEVLGWMLDTTRSQATETISKTALDVIAGEAFNVSRVDYTGPEPPLDESASFLNMLATALRHHHNVMAANPPTRMEMHISDLEFGNTLSYISARRTILVPTVYQCLALIVYEQTMQNDPYLYPFRVPDYFNYGTLGAFIAVKLAEVVGIGVKHPSQSSWDQDTQANHAKLLSCLAERRKNMGFGDLDSGTAGAQQTLMVTLSLGVRLAYISLTDAFRKKAGTRKVFNDYLPEAQHVFFSRFCLLWCNAAETPGTLTAREKCMLPLYNMEEFAERYNCKGHANFTTAAFCQA